MNNPSFPFHTPPYTANNDLQATIETNLQGNHYHRRSSSHHHVNNNNESIMNSPFWGLVLGSDGQMHPVSSSDVLGGSMKQIGSVPIYMALPSTTINATSTNTNSGLLWSPATSETNPLSSSANAGVIGTASSSLSLLKPTTTAGFSNSQFLSNNSMSPLLGSWPHLVATQLPSTAAASLLQQQQQRMAVPPNHWANANSIMAHPLVAAAAAASYTQHQQQQHQQQQQQPEGWLSRMAFALNTSVSPMETLTTNTTDARGAAGTIPKTDRQDAAAAATSTTTPFPVPSQSTILTTATTTTTSTTTSPRHNATVLAESPAQAHSRKIYPGRHDDDSQVDQQQQQQQQREEEEENETIPEPPPPPVRRRKRKHHFKNDLQQQPSPEEQQQHQDEHHCSNIEHDDDNNTIQNDNNNNTAATKLQQPLFNIVI